MKNSMLLLLVFGCTQIIAQNHYTSISSSSPESNKERYDFKRSKERLLAIPKLIVWLPDCDFKMDFKVLSFECFVETKKENFWFNNHGENYSQELVEALQQVKPGDKIYFDHVLCQGLDLRVRNIGTTRVTIVP